MTTKPHPQSILLRLSDVSDANVSTGHRAAYVTTTLASIVQGLRNLECQPDPFNELQGPDALLDELLATLSGLEANGLDRGALVRAALCQEITRREDAERQVATLTRERDEARAGCASVLEAHANGVISYESGVCMCGDTMPCKQGDHAPVDSGEHYVHGLVERLRKITIPTPGAQA